VHHGNGPSLSSEKNENKEMKGHSVEAIVGLADTSRKHLKDAYR
jgi:hypothetical protein